MAQSRGEQSLVPDPPEPSPLLRQVAKEVVAAEAVLVRLDCASSVSPVSSLRVRLAICISDLIVAADPNRPHGLHRPLLVVLVGGLVVRLLVVLAGGLLVLLVVLLLVVLEGVSPLVVVFLVVLALVEEAM